MKSFFLIVALIAVPWVSDAQITSEDTEVVQVEETGWPIRLRFEVGGGRSTLQAKDADGNREGDIRIPTRGYVLGFSATTKEKSRYSGFLSMHYLRRGYDVDVVATVQELEQNLQAEGLDVTLNNVLGFAKERTHWMEGQLGLRTSIGKRFCAQGGVYVGRLLGGSVDRNFWWDMTTWDPSSETGVTVGVYANNTEDIVAIRGELSEERIESLVQLHGESVVLRRQFSTGLTFEMSAQVAGGELTLGYRHSVSNLVPKLAGPGSGAQSFGSQQFVSLRFGIFLN